MTNEELIGQAYAAYNRQDADALSALVSEDVDWPDGHVRLHGKQELRTYWIRQWAETHTRDEVLGLAMPTPNRSIVRIRQAVHALAGAVISTGTFEHEYLIEDRLITRLDIRRSSMDVGIVGAGHVGSALARVFSTLGHRVRIANSRGPDTRSELALQSGVTAAWAADAVSNAELLVIATPEKSMPTLASDTFRGAAADVVIVSAGNYYPRQDGAVLEVEEGLPESAWVSQCIKWLVTKASTTSTRSFLGPPAGRGGGSSAWRCPSQATMQGRKPWSCRLSATWGSIQSTADQFRSRGVNSLERPFTAQIWMRMASDVDWPKPTEGARGNGLRSRTRSSRSKPSPA